MMLLHGFQVRLLGEHTDHEPEEIEKTISRPKYFDPYEAVKYGIIDRVRCFRACQQLFCKLV